MALSGYELIKDALVTHGQQFAGRPPALSNERLKSYTPNFPLLGIYFNEGLILLHDDVIKWKHFPRGSKFAGGMSMKTGL